MADSEESKGNSRKSSHTRTSSDPFQSQNPPRTSSDLSANLPGDLSLRLNPVVVKKRGLKPYALGETRTVVDLQGSSNAGLLSAPADNDLDSMRNALGIAQQRNTPANNGGVFSSMFEIPNLKSLNDASIGSVEGQDHKMPPRAVSWWQVTLYVINDVIGAWLILYSVALLGLYGWLLGVALLLLLWPVNLYGAHLLWRCRNVFPGAISLGDLVRYLTRSATGMYLTFVLVNITIALTLASQVQVAASNVYWLVSKDFLQGHCYAVFLAGICLVLFPLTQLRFLHSLTVINVVSIACMLIFVIISMYFLAEDGRPEDVVTRLGLNEEALKESVELDMDIPRAPILAIDLVITAYYYQLIILEIIAEMKDPSQFPKANYWATPIVLFVTLGSAGFRYYYQGEQNALAFVTENAVFDSIFGQHREALSYFAMACFTVHMLGCCLIRSVVLTRSLHLLIHPMSANSSSWRALLTRAGIAFFVVALAWALSILIRETRLMSLISGFLVIITSIMGPVILYLLCCRRTKQLKRIPWYDWFMIVAILTLSLATFAIYFVKFGWRVANNELGSDLRNGTATQMETLFDCKDFF